MDAEVVATGGDGILDDLSLIQRKGYQNVMYDTQKI
ncbi:hypothetical protein Godav_025371 [Gossypium davidsonii]|uniref:Uncharacterized protein n=1 Tax=Gossypium davidsonii TaxID=34287 RepID=A0A7J8TG07_GOSDV|nr:hypothetical protein [Gossypium davidsonii]